MFFKPNWAKDGNLIFAISRLKSLSIPVYAVDPRNLEAVEFGDLSFGLFLHNNPPMSTRKAHKKKAQRKSKLKARRETQQAGLRSDKADFFFLEAQWYLDQQNYEKALPLLRKALKLNPHNSDFMHSWPISATPWRIRMLNSMGCPGCIAAAS